MPLLSYAKFSLVIFLGTYSDLRVYKPFPEPVSQCFNLEEFKCFAIFFMFSKVKIELIHLYTTQYTRSKVSHIIDFTSNSLECSFLWLKGEAREEIQAMLRQLI